jgi:hypothetical protein
LVQDSEIVADMPVASVARGVGHDNHVDPRWVPLRRARRLGGHGHRLAGPFAVNALFHLAAWIALGDYAPGAVTVVSIPATGHFRRGRHRRCGGRDRVPLAALTAAPVSVRTALKSSGTFTNQTISQNAGALGSVG